MAPLVSDIDDLIGAEEKVSEMPEVKLGQIVHFHSNNPLEDGMLTRAAIVTKKNLNGSVSLTVFDEGHEQYFSKIPIAARPQPGYYTVEHLA